MSGAKSVYTGLLERARELVDFEKTLLDASMREAAPLASGELVDIGCGDKPYEKLFAPFVTKYVGVEYDETYGTSDYARTNPKADVVYQGSRLPFDDASFDTVLSNQVGEHVPDPRAFFAELVRVLRPGGCLIYTIPFSYRIHSEPHDYHRFTKYALVQYAEAVGLVVDRIKPRGGFWSVIGQKLTSHLALRYGRLASDVQSIGGFGYEQTVAQRPRYWVLPVLAPAIVGIAATTKILDRIDHDETDTIGYLLVARKGRS
jgi:SAM-dependent methyltransferase